MIKIIITKTGAQSTIIGKPRTTFTHLGVPIGGAMDNMAYQKANILLNNNINEPAIETTLIGPTIIFKEACHIALTGATMTALLNNENIPYNKAIAVRKNSTLQLKSTKTNNYTYIAIAGKWNIKPSFGSRATLISTKTNQLTKNQTIYIDNSNHNNSFTEINTTLKNKQTIRLFKGPEFNQLADKSIQELNTLFSINHLNNRMGSRLNEKLNHINYQEIHSSGVLPGTLQMTKDGSLTILMRDAQTTGGYPRIGIIHSEDIDKIAQLQTNDTFKFTLID